MGFARVLITGDRDWKDEAMVFRVIAKLNKDYGDDVLVIHGDARGADTAAENACRTLQMARIVAPARWGKYKRAAGPIRNRWMLKYGQPDYFIAFHDDLQGSSGTLDMVTACREAGISGYHFSHGPDGEEHVEAFPG